MTNLPLAEHQGQTLPPIQEYLRIFAVSLHRHKMQKMRGYGPGRFSFNVKGGRCEACEGDGIIQIAMHFLPDIFVPCEVCKGARYNRETLEVKYKGKKYLGCAEYDSRGRLPVF